MSPVTNRINEVKTASAKPLKVYFLFVCLALIAVPCASAATTPVIRKPPPGSQIHWNHS